MKFTLISDIHADSNQWDWNILDECDPTIPMVVAGDIANDVWQTCHWITELRNRFPTVVFVAGNHDFYNSGFHKTRIIPSKEWAEKWPAPSNVEELYDHYARWFKAHDIHFLHRGAVEIDGIQFIGATGWHDFKYYTPSTDLQITAWKKYISDSRYINWNSDIPHNSVIDAAKLDFASISNEIQKNTLPKIIVTHHIPHRSLAWKKPHDPIWTALHGSFCNSMMEKITSSDVKCWVYGHTHQRTTNNINGIDYICNARGYDGENTSWTPIEITI